MKIATMNVNDGRWLVQLEADVIRNTTSHGVFDLRDRDGSVQFGTPEGTIRLAPRASNVVEVDAYTSHDGRPFSEGTDQ